MELELDYDNIWRQGDVAVIFIKNSKPVEGNAIPRKNGRIIVAEGEVTGHAHAVLEPEVKWLETTKHERVLVSDVPFSLTHDEHDPHWFAPGQYLTIIQSEADLDSMRSVLD